METGPDAGPPRPSPGATGGSSAGSMASGLRSPEADRPPTWLGAMWLVCTADLRRRIRNRSALVTAFVGPLAFAIVFGTLIGGATSADYRIGVADLDRSDLTTQLTGALTAGQGADDAGGAAGREGGGDGTPAARSDEEADVQLELVALEDRATAEREVDDGDVDAAIVVPEGYSAAVAAGDAPSLVVLRSPERTIAGQIAESVANSVASRVVLGTTASRLADEQTGRPPPAGLVDRALDAPPTFLLTDVPAGGNELDPTAYFGASMSILFLFFTTGFAARSMIAEKKDGTLSRLLAGPTAPGAIVVGKTLSVGLLGLAGFVTVWLVTSALFGAEWGPAPAVLVLMVATVLAIAGLATLVASFAGTTQQAEAYTSAVSFAFALIGGNFFGPGQLPAALEQVSLLTPNRWALRAFTDLATGSADLMSVLPAIVVLLAFAVVLGAAGMGRLHRLVRA